MNEQSKPIVLKAQPADNCVGVIRLTPEAERVARRLQNRCGLSIRKIVSEILIQAESLIDIDLSNITEEDNDQ
jgi:hypothetical protein